MKLPAFQFYPADWKKDPGVQALSRHDRSVWFDILCLMHESEERGKLLLNGAPMPNAALARILALDLPTLEQSLETILSYGVASLDDSGAFICRRMVRDEFTREVSREGGKTGGNPKLTFGYNQPGFVYFVRRGGDGAVKIGIAKNVTNRVYKIRYQMRPHTIELLGFVAVEDMGKEEAALHLKFKQQCIGGEWFSLSEDQISSLGKDDFDHKGKNKGEPNGKPRASSSSSSSSSDKEPPNPQGGTGRKSDNLPSSPNAIRISQLFSRRLTTKWSAKEIRAFKAIGPMDPEDLELVCRYTEAERAKGDAGKHRRDLLTFLNNFTGEIDRAREKSTTTQSTPKARQWVDEP